MVADPKAQKDWQFDCIFCAFGICEHKSCSQNVDEINLRCELNLRCDKEKEIILQIVKRKCFENARKTKLPTHLKEIFFYAADKGDLESVQKVWIFYNLINSYF